jgi:hypothetical protein
VKRSAIFLSFSEIFSLNSTGSMQALQHCLFAATIEAPLARSQQKALASSFFALPLGAAHSDLLCSRLVYEARALKNMGCAPRLKTNAI